MHTETTLTAITGGFKVNFQLAIRWQVLSMNRPVVRTVLTVRAVPCMGGPCKAVPAGPRVSYLTPLSLGLLICKMNIL